MPDRHAAGAELLSRSNATIRRLSSCSLSCSWLFELNCLSTLLIGLSKKAPPRTPAYVPADLRLS